jgi:YVTN family beta-propeller protein
MKFRTSFAAGAIALIGTGLFVHMAPTVEGQSIAAVNFEGAQTNPIRLSPDGARLFAVNTANASLSVFDVSQPDAPVLIREIPVGLEPVSVNPRTNDEAWVVNQLSDSISIVSVARGIVVDTLRIPDEPMDVVFAGLNRAYVSVSRKNAIAIFDTTTRSLTRVLPVFGGNPRALAVSPDGRRVYAAFALAGNGTTALRPQFVPPPPAPTNPALPPPPQVALIVAADDPAWSENIDYTMPDNDVVVIVNDPVPRVGGYYSGVGTVNLGLAVNPVTSDIFVANTEARNLVRFEPALRGHWVDNRITRIRRLTGQVTPFDLNPGIDYSVLPNPAARATALAQPTAVVFDPSGQFMYVAAFGTDRVAQVDTAGNVIGFVEVGPPSGSGPNVDPRNKRGPRGLALRPDGQILYALNRISNTISVIDTGTQSVVRELLTGTDTTPAAIRVGRGFLYDAKLSGNGTGSCASCHIDGDMDQLAWDLGDPGGEMLVFQQAGKIVSFHPMKGPMTTQTLRGLAGTSPFHWRGDKRTFLEFNAAFDGLMGGTPVSIADMAAYAAFVTTLVYHPNPNLNLDRTFPATIRGGDPAAGEQVFLTVRQSRPGPVTCSACHTINPGAGTNRQIRDPVGTSVPQSLKVPQMRNVYQKLLFNKFAGTTIGGFGLNHEGHVSGFLDFLSGTPFTGYTNEQKTDMMAFMLCFDTGTAPAVGYTITSSPDNIDDAQLQADWTTLQQQAQAQDITLVVSGTLNGQVRRLTYRPLEDHYTIDAATTAPLTRNQLESLVRGGDSLTFMGTAPDGLAATVTMSVAAGRTSQSTSRGH